MAPSNNAQEPFDPEVPLQDLATRLRWAELFGNDRPVEIEVGFGKGRFLITAGERFPEANYFGIERKLSHFRIARPRIQKRNLRNVRIVITDALPLIHEVIPPASVRAYHVYFPDPWWKKRHKKRRIFTPVLLEDLARTLIPSGQIYIASDVEEYFGEIAAMVGENPAFRLLDDPAGRMERAGYVPTNFEVKMAGAGHPIHRAVYERV
ncbi:MAG: tRNA (guanosine(46)-N7)-methyltransferase TrmB [Nitrospinota bacterium]|nr:tRNA (guanosine(46)-N7)-methyltransferase TrmB [Nitrospinota bacterium]